MTGFGQNDWLARDSMALKSLEEVKLTPRLKSSWLPYKVDNSQTIHFPPIFLQHGWSCNQSSSVGYIFTYELNALRNKNAADERNRFPPFFTWNFLNSGNVEQGVSYFDSWEVVKAIGCPSWADFGTYQANETKWMSNYQGYHRGMQNRVKQIRYIDVGTREGLLTLKHWLYNHLGEYQPGGVANFQIASAGMVFVQLPEGTEEAGKNMIPSFRPEVGHAMTFVGYNDSVRYDFNGDGKFTNDLDINSDGKVTMYDWEIGALICVNTYGSAWGDHGHAYIPYRILERNHLNGGIWMRSAVITSVYDEYRPKLTMRVRVTHHNRRRLSITAGVAADPNASAPDHTLNLPVFNFQGGSFPMRGNTGVNAAEIEVGLDVTPLLNYVEPGSEAAFFLVVSDMEPVTTNPGMIHYYSFIDYTRAEEEYYGGDYYIPIDQKRILQKVVFTTHADPPAILTKVLPGGVEGEYYSQSLEAAGGEPPYRWLPLAASYHEETIDAQFPEIMESRVLPVIGNSVQVQVSLPFVFPYCGTGYTKMTLLADGGIVFAVNGTRYPYAIDQKLLLQQNIAVYPWYNADLQLPYFSDWVYYQADSDVAVVRWNATLMVDERSSDVNFAAKLYPSGVIEFYYGYFQNRVHSPWLAGLAGGTAERSWFPAINVNGVYEGLALRFTPPRMPAGMEISPDGYFRGTPMEAGVEWEIPFIVEDKTRLRGSRTLSFSTKSTGYMDDLMAEFVDRLVIFPNPATDQIMIEVKPSIVDCSLLIVDCFGREIQRVEVPAGTSSISVTVEDLPAGVYFIRVGGEVGRFVKN